MKKILVIATVAIFTIALATIYSNSSRAGETPSPTLTADSTHVKTTEQKVDSTNCTHNKDKAEGCKKSCASPCCKKN